MTGEKTTVRFTPAALRVLNEWRSNGWDLQVIVNAGILLWHQAEAATREAAQKSAYGGGSETEIIETTADSVPPGPIVVRKMMKHRP